MGTKKLKFKRGKAQAQITGDPLVQVEERFGELHIIRVDPDSPWHGKLRERAIIRTLIANDQTHQSVSALDFKEAHGIVRIEFEYPAKGKSLISKIIPIDFHDDFLDSEDERELEEDSIEIELDVSGEAPRLTLSESIYTAAIVIPVAFEPWNCFNLFRATQVIFLYFLNVFSQFALALYVRYMWEKQAENDTSENMVITSCGPYDLQRREFATSFPLQVICILVYTAICVGDLVESFSMIMWIWYAPRSKGCGRPMSVSWGPDREFTVMQSGIPCCLKLWGTFIVLSKLLVASVLLLWGGGYILGSPSNEDLLLNALAISFIMDIDEVMFTLFLPRSIQSFCSEKLPTVIAETRTVEMFMRFANVFGMTINVGILSAGASVTWRYFCKNAEPSQ